MSVTVKRPMKAPGKPISDKDLAIFVRKHSKLGLACSPKLDGIRALLTGDEVLSASLKRIGNQYIQRCLSKPEYAGLDCELVVGSPYAEHDEDDVFHRTSGPVRRAAGEPDFKAYIFDDFTDTSLTYKERWLDQIADDPEMATALPHIVIVEQRICHTLEEILEFEAECMEKGYEGIMVRTLDGRYKEDRCTFNEALIYKRKPILDDEGYIVGYYEMEENRNEQVTSELGTSKRSAHKENKYPKGTLGGFIIDSKLWKGKTFRCGTIIGGTVEWRLEAWKNRDRWIGRLVKYKYQGIGSIDKPRQPRMCGIRDTSDMTDF